MVVINIRYIDRVDADICNLYKVHKSCERAMKAQKQLSTKERVIHYFIHNAFSMILGHF